MYTKSKEKIEKNVINSIFIENELVKHILVKGVDSYLITENYSFKNKDIKYKKIKIKCNKCYHIYDKSYNNSLLSLQYFCRKCVRKYKPKKKKINRTRKIDIGLRVGILTIIDIKRINNRNIYILKCDCGNNITKNSSSFRSNISCGCLKNNKKSGKDSPNFRGYEEIHAHYWGSIVRGAKLRKLDFSITIKDAWNIYLKQDRKCALTKMDISFSKSIKDAKDTSASLDRIDSSKGYTIDNVQWVHKKINIMKMNLSQDEFINLCKKVSINF